VFKRGKPNGNGGGFSGCSHVPSIPHAAEMLRFVIRKITCSVGQTRSRTGGAACRSRDPTRSDHPQAGRGAGRKGQDARRVVSGAGEERSGRTSESQTKDAGCIGGARTHPVQSRSASRFGVDRTAGLEVAVTDHPWRADPGGSGPLRRQASLAVAGCLKVFQCSTGGLAHRDGRGICGYLCRPRLNRICAGNRNRNWQYIKVSHSLLTSQASSERLGPSQTSHTPTVWGRPG